MDNVQPNGEPKKIFLTKPIEQPLINPDTPSTSSSSSPPPYRPIRGFVGTRVRIPPRRHMPPVDKNPEDHLTNQRKQRYWNSWEELYIVELWRRYRDEVTILNVPLPVYRKMMIAMRNRNMLVTAQDCRRKINTTNTRYRTELRRMETSGCKSDWRLFPLVHCIMSPIVKDFDAWHETKIIKKLLDKIPKPVEVKPSLPPPPPCVAINTNIFTNQPSQSLQNSSQHIRSLQQSLPPPQILESSSTNKPPTTITKLPTTTNILPTTTNRLSTMRTHRNSILPFRNITLDKIEQLRQDNNRLASERDEMLQLLQLEKREFLAFESYIKTWKAQKELELQMLQQISENCVFQIENEENHNVEQQLQESTVGVI